MGQDAGGAWTGQSAGTVYTSDTKAAFESVFSNAVTKDPTGIMKAVEGKSAIWIQLPGGIPATASALALIGDEMSTGTAAIFDPDTQAPSIDIATGRHTRRVRMGPR